MALISQSNSCSGTCPVWYGPVLVRAKRFRSNFVGQPIEELVCAQSAPGTNSSVGMNSPFIPSLVSIPMVYRQAVLA